MSAIDDSTPYSHTDGDPWDAPCWLADFRRTSKARSGLRELRALVFESTTRIVRAHGYRRQGRFVGLPAEGLAASHAGTVMYARTDHLVVSSAARSRHHTVISVVNGDCLESAAGLLTEGHVPAVLNMASRRNPGGGVHHGAGAQEENLFRRSTLFYSLYQFATYADEYGVPPSPRAERYPIGRMSGAIYSPGVLVFRSSEATGYDLLAAPFEIAVLTVPAISNPDVEIRDGQPWLTQSMAAGTLRKMRAILRVAAHHRHDAVVLSAFGCGAFRNPAAHIARLFRQVLCEAEFEGVFERVVFAIIDDHNAFHRGNPQGNFRPFLEVFGPQKNRS